MRTAIETSTPTVETLALQQVVVVSRQSHINGLLGTVLDASRCVVFVESTGHAYSQIKRLSPNLIIVCLDIDDVEGLQVLSMLKLDSETKRIPVMTCTISGREESPLDEWLGPPDDGFYEAPAMGMN